MGSKISYIILEEIKIFFKSFDFDWILLGFYSNGISDRMVIYAELFTENEFKQLSNLSLVRGKGMFEINNYYENLNNNPNVFKFEF